jgi:hypothetical protein
VYNLSQVIKRGLNDGIMAVSKKSLENLEKGKKFSKENQPENNGRRPNVLDKYIKVDKLSHDDLRALISSLAIYNADEIKQILNDKKDKPPIATVLILKAIMSDMEKGNIDNFEKLAARAYGKPLQPLDIPPETLSRLSMTPEERKKRIDELLKKRGDKSSGKSGRKRAGRTSLSS